MDCKIGLVKQDNETTLQPFFMIFERLLAKTDHSAWLHIVYGVSSHKLRCLVFGKAPLTFEPWKSSCQHVNIHRKDTYIPSLYDFGLAQTLSCTNQTWGEYFGKVLPFSRMYGMMYSHDKMMVNTKPLGPTISG